MKYILTILIILTFFACGEPEKTNPSNNCLEKEVELIKNKRVDAIYTLWNNSNYSILTEEYLKENNGYKSIFHTLNKNIEKESEKLVPEISDRYSLSFIWDKDKYITLWENKTNNINNFYISNLSKYYIFDNVINLTNEQKDILDLPKAKLIDNTLGVLSTIKVIHGVKDYRKINFLLVDKDDKKIKKNLLIETSERESIDRSVLKKGDDDFRVLFISNSLSGSYLKNATIKKDGTFSTNSLIKTKEQYITMDFIYNGKDYGFIYDDENKIYFSEFRDNGTLKILTPIKLIEEEGRENIYVTKLIRNEKNYIMLWNKCIKISKCNSFLTEFNNNGEILNQKDLKFRASNLRYIDGQYSLTIKEELEDRKSNVTFKTFCSIK